MITRARTSLFLASAVILVPAAVVGAVVAHGAALGAVISFAVPIALGLAAVVTALASVRVARAVDQLAREAQRRMQGESPAARSSDDRELGQLGGWLDLMATDVERGRATLERERALSSLVLEGMSQGVIALDRDRRIVLMNAAARALLGLSSSPVGEPLIETVRVPALLDLVGGVAGSAEVQLSPGHTVLARVTAPSSGDGRVLILEDVTTVRKLETVRRDFVANVSHELRTPVSIIRANAETLQSGAADDPVMAPKLIDGLHRNAERLARILADLLDLSRLDAGQYRVEVADVALRAAVDAAVASVETPVRERQLTLQVEVDAGLAVRGDAKALDQVLVNLLDNAVKYTPAGGEVRVTAATREDGRVRIMVCDNGPGIAPKHRDRIFERFYRVDPGRSREAGGTGLGLSIVKHLVESMGGDIGVEGAVPQGTRFWFDLPAVAPR